MTLKADIYGHTLVAAMLFFAAAAGVFLLGLAVRRRIVRAIGEALFLAGSATVGGLWAYRWQHVGHLPMQTMFEIFLTMGMAIYPLSAFCRYVLGGRLAFADALVAICFAFPPAFISGAGFSAEPKNLPPALQSWLFAPHVAVYMLAYVILFMAAFHGVGLLAISLLTRGDSRPDLAATETDFERVTYRLTCLGFPMLTLGLILGAVWGKIAWGDYWSWDPKEMWSLASWFVYLGYFHFRYMFPTRYREITAMWAIAGAAVIVLTLLSTVVPQLAGAGGMHTYSS